MEKTQRSSTCVSRLIRSSRHELYAACLDAEMLAKWRVPHDMEARIEVFDPHEGGMYRMSLTYTDPEDAARGKTSGATDTFEGKFLRLVPNREIVEGVVFKSDDPDFSGEMIMTTEFEDDQEGTLVTVRCEDLPRGIRPEDNEMGCRMALENLAKLVE